MILRYLIEKEFKQLLRNKFLPRLIIMFPLMIILVMPRVATFDIKEILIAVVDDDHSQLSNRLVNKIEASDYFTLVSVEPSYDEAYSLIESREADIILHIPYRFEEDMVSLRSPSVQVSANAVNGTKGNMGVQYLSSILTSFSAEARLEYGSSLLSRSPLGPSIEMSLLSRFNPLLDYKFFMIPALMVMLLTMICGFLPAFNIVIEKERGTIEQINVTPVSRATFIVAKLLPFWLVGLLVFSLTLVFAWLLYGLWPVGSLASIYLAVLLYALIVSGLGLSISTISESMQQAQMVMMCCMLVLVLLSGLFTPIAAMPYWAQCITKLNPMTYFIEIIRMSFLKGSTIEQMSHLYLSLFVFGVVVNSLAIFSYRKRG